MTDIIDLQQQYLQSQSEAVLSQLYISLVKIGKVIISKEELKIEQDAAYDIASTVVIRLRDEKALVIRSNPSAYIKRSLFYILHNRQRTADYNTVEIPENSSSSDTYFDEDFYDLMVHDVLEHVEVPEEVAYEVHYCLYTKQDYRTVKRRIRTGSRQMAFYKTMESIHEYISQTVMQSTWMPNDGAGRSLLREAQVSGAERQRTQGKMARPEQRDPQLLLFSEMAEDETASASDSAMLRSMWSASQ